MRYLMPPLPRRAAARRRPARSRTHATMLCALAALLLSRAVRAQSAAPAPPANQQAAPTDQKAKTQPQKDDQADQNPYPTQLNLELHTPPEQAKALLSSIDGLLNFSSEHSGLPIRSKVQGQLIDRKGVKERREKDLSKEDVIARIRRSSLILKKLGLVPRDFDLPSFALDSPDDPLAGFYDPATKIFYMLDWVPAEGQYPVMAHELTHALQDQYVGLERWMKIPGSAGADGDSDDNGRDETSTARRAVAEGQATAVMLDYVLAPYGRALTDLPVIDESTIQNLMQRRTSPALLRAPRYIRESAVFPYVYGLAFIHDVLKKSGKERAFAGVLKNPPQNSRQVMHPAAYLAGEKIAPLPLPAFAPALPGSFDRLDSGTFGEFDALMFAEQYTSAEKARQISTLWRGGYYYAAEPKLVKAETKSSTATVTATVPADDPGAVGLLLVSRWATPVAAREFADLYAASVGERYAGATRQSSSGKPAGPGEKSFAWQTSDGLVSVETRNTLVLAMESFDEPTATRLRAIVTQSSSANH